MNKHSSMRRLISIAAALVLALSLTGCHGARSRTGFTVPETFDTDKTHEITFWAKNDTNKTQTQIYEKAIRDFEALYPNIKVKIRLYTDYGKIYNDVITNIATNTTPDVCITYPDHIATYRTGSDVVVPLDDLLADSRYGLGGSELLYEGPGQDGIIPEFLSECVLSGSTYALPFMRSTEACYVNRTFVEALGYEMPEVLTWDFVWEVSEAAMKKNADGTFAVNGQKVMIPFIYKSTDNMMIQMLRQKDGGYSTDAGEILIFNDTTRELLLTIAEHAKTGAFSTFKISSYPANFLNAGQCIFAVDSTAGSTWMGAGAPLSDISDEAKVDFETEVCMVPQFDPSTPAMISQGPSVCIFNKEDPQQVLASWLFAQYLLTNDVQTAYAETEGYVPVTVPARASEAYQDYLASGGEDGDLHYQVKIDATRLLLDSTEHTFVTPVFNGSASLRDASGQLIENVTKSVRRKETVDSAYIDKLFSTVRSMYRLDQIEAQGGERDLGPLPAESKALLICLGVAWGFIAACWLREQRRQRKS